MPQGISECTVCVLHDTTLSVGRVPPPHVKTKHPSFHKTYMSVFTARDYLFYVVVYYDYACTPGKVHAYDTFNSVMYPM